MTTSTIKIGDIDIDCANRDHILTHINYIPAKKTDGSKHITGVYVQDIPFDPLTMLAEDDYENSKFTKIDFLNLSFLSHFKSNSEIEELMSIEPDWDMLMLEHIVKELPQIHDHYKLVFEMRPKSVEDLVAILNKIREHSVYKFKKSHGVAYALNIVVMLNYFRKYNVQFLPEDSILSSDIFELR